MGQQNTAGAVDSVNAIWHFEQWSPFLPVTSGCIGQAKLVSDALSFLVVFQA